LQGIFFNVQLLFQIFGLTSQVIWQW